MGCHGNRAFSHSQNKLTFYDNFLSHLVGLTLTIGMHERMHDSALIEFA